MKPKIKSIDIDCIRVAYEINHEDTGYTFYATMQKDHNHQYDMVELICINHNWKDVPKKVEDKANEFIEEQQETLKVELTTIRP